MNNKLLLFMRIVAKGLIPHTAPGTPWNTEWWMDYSTSYHSISQIHHPCPELYMYIHVHVPTSTCTCTCTCTYIVCWKKWNRGQWPDHRSMEDHLAAVSVGVRNGDAVQCITTICINVHTYIHVHAYTITLPVVQNMSCKTVHSSNFISSCSRKKSEQWATKCLHLIYTYTCTCTVHDV